MRLGVPLRSGKNREAGENPARSRHCEDRRLCLNDDAKARRPAQTPLQLLNAREKVFRPQGFLFSEKIPSPACRLYAAERVTGFVF